MFKKGDIVICIKENLSMLDKLGEKYTVLNTSVYDHIKLKETNQHVIIKRFQLAYIKEFQDKLDTLIEE